MEAMLEEERNQACHMAEEKIVELNGIERELKARQVDLRGEVEKVEERVNLRVNK